MADIPEETVKNGLNSDQGDATDGNTATAISSSEGKKKKKGKNKNKVGGEAGAVPGTNLSADQQDKLKKAMELLNMQTQGGGGEVQKD